MPKVCIQSGHENRKTGATGAPGEQEFTVRIGNRLAERLREYGFTVRRQDADIDTPSEQEVLKTDWDLFLSVHGDADVYGSGGGFVDFPEPSSDGATKESQRIAKAIESEYFNHSGIENKPSRSNANTRYYYMWKMLSSKTPCVIIECGVMQNAHDKVILADTERITNAILRGILKAFNIAYKEPGQDPAPAPTPPMQDNPDIKKLYEVADQLKKRVEELAKSIADNSDEIKRVVELLKKTTDRVGEIEATVEEYHNTLSGQLSDLKKEVKLLKDAPKPTPEVPEKPKDDNPFIKILKALGILGG